MPKIDPVTKHAKRIIRGTIPACKFVKQAAQRHLDDLTRKDLFFDSNRVDLVFKFIGQCKHYKGDLAGEPIELDESQKFIIGSVFGWYWKKTGRRRYRKAYVEVPRKNGKSTLASAVGNYLLIGDGEAGAEVFAVATKEDQAKIVWSAAKEMIMRNRHLKRLVKPFHNSLFVHSSSSVFKPLGSDSDTLDGLNPHGAICDELHAWKKRDLLDVIEDGMGARSQPLLFIITTAGFNKEGVCYETRNHGVQVLDPGGYEDDAFFCYIATIDEKDDWKDPKTWAKANPLLGVSKQQEYMEQQCQQAQQLPGKLNAFLNKQLNVWTDAAVAWLDRERWDKMADPDWQLQNLHGETCYLGVDLSATTDLTATVYVFPPRRGSKKYRLYPRFFIPEANLKARQDRDKVPFQLWVDQGWVQVTPGEVVDYDFVRADISSHKALFNIKEIAIDPWNQAAIAPKLIEEGFEVFSVRQGFQSLSAPSKEFEKLIIDRNISHDGNPCMRWNIANAVAELDAAENKKPAKNKSTGRIDGVAGSVNAFARILEQEGDKPSVYESRGLRVIR